MPFVPDAPQANSPQASSRRGRFVPDTAPQGAVSTPVASPAASPSVLDNAARLATSIHPIAAPFAEAATQAVGSMVAGPSSGLAGIAGSILPGQEGQGANWVEKLQQMLTYQPRSAGGQLVEKAAGVIPGAIARGGDAVGQVAADVTGSPLIGAAVNTGAQSAPALLLRGRAGRIAENVNSRAPAAPGGSRPAPAANAVPAGRQAGSVPVSETAPSPVQAAIDNKYILKPSEAGGKAGAVIEGLSGSAKFETSAVVRNQRNTDRLVREEFKLPEGPISRGAIANAKKPHNAVYDQVSRLGEVKTGPEFRTEISNVGRTPGQSFKKDTNPEVENLKAAYADEMSFAAADAVLKVRELRYKSRKNIGSDDPAKQELGYAQRSIAEALDNQLARHAESVGKGGLGKRFSAARQELARLNSLETAARGGEVSAPILAKMLERGVPLSGKLRTIAETAQNYPNVMREGRKVKGNTPVNMAETLVGGIGAYAIDPTFIGAMVARPAARALLRSSRYQNSLVKPAKKQQSTPKKEERRNALLEY